MYDNLRNPYTLRLSLCDRTLFRGPHPINRLSLSHIRSRHFIEIPFYHTIRIIYCRSISVTQGFVTRVILTVVERLQ